MVTDLTEYAKHNGKRMRCTFCHMGWGSVTQWTDERGHLMQEVKSCADECRPVENDREILDALRSL